MIPGLNLETDPNVAALSRYIIQEYRTSRDLRRELEVSWMAYLEAYRVPLPTKRKTFPFPGAANLTVPLIGGQVDQVYSRFMAMLFGTENLWSCKALHPDYIDSAPKITEFLGWAQRNELNVYNEIADMILEMCKLGTGVMKTRYRREWKKVFEFREAQTRDAAETYSTGALKDVLLHNAPTLEHVSLWDFFVPATALDIKNAAWCGHRFRLTKEQYLGRVRAGLYMYDPIVAGSFNESPNHLIAQLQRMDKYTEWNGSQAEFVEFWLDYDIHGTGEMCSIMCVLHDASQKIIRVDYNPYINQEKPFDFVRFMRVEKRFYGIGLCEMLMQFQLEVTTMHNQRIDAGTINTMPMFKGLKTGNIKQNEPLFPGRILLLDSLDEFSAMPFAGQVDSTSDDESTTMQYARDRTGANDYVTGGDAPSVGYSTAFTSANQAKEGAKRFDQTLREIRAALSSAGTKIFELYQQFNQGGKAYYVSGEEDGQVIEKVLNMPLDLARKGLLIDVAATSAAYNKDVELRTQMLILKDVTGYYQQLMQYIGMAVNPQTPPELRMVAQRSAMGLSTVVSRILDLHGMQDVSRVAINPAEIIGNGQQPGAIQPLAGPNGGPQGALAAPGMGALPAGDPTAMEPDGGGTSQEFGSGTAIPSAGQAG